MIYVTSQLCSFLTYGIGRGKEKEVNINYLLEHERGKRPRMSPMNFARNGVRKKWVLMNDI